MGRGRYEIRTDTVRVRVRARSIESSATSCVRRWVGEELEPGRHRRPDGAEGRSGEDAAEGGDKEERKGGEKTGWGPCPTRAGCRLACLRPASGARGRYRALCALYTAPYTPRALQSCTARRKDRGNRRNLDSLAGEPVSLSTRFRQREPQSAEKPNRSEMVQTGPKRGMWRRSAARCEWETPGGAGTYRVDGVFWTLLRGLGFLGLGRGNELRCLWFCTHGLVI